MGVLRLRNCTNDYLQYWRMIAFARINYLSPGAEGEYHWGATYTLSVRIGDNESTRANRAAVNQNGIYYVWKNDSGRLEILSEAQAASHYPNQNNPHFSQFLRPLPPQRLEIDGITRWVLIAERHNTGSMPYNITIRRRLGIEWSRVENHQLTFTNSNSVNVNYMVSPNVGGWGGGVSTSFTIENQTMQSIREANNTELEYVEQITVPAGSRYRLWQARFEGGDIRSLMIPDRIVGGVDAPDPVQEEGRSRVALTFSRR